MMYFPVTHSIPSTKAIETILIELYGVRASVELIQSRIADTYTVSTNRKRYIFKVYRYGWRTRSQLLYVSNKRGSDGFGHRLVAG